MVISCHVKEYIYCILKIDSSRPVRLLLLADANPTNGVLVHIYKQLFVLEIQI